MTYDENRAMIDNIEDEHGTSTPGVSNLIEPMGDVSRMPTLWRGA
ncbi:hypothetical protein [Actinopolyspora mortivallis]|nr:hypothetical protein [Actinopolyspora mortivallis]